MIRQVKYISFFLLAACCMSWQACTQQRALCLTPTIASLTIEFMHHIPNDTAFVDTALPAAVFIPLTKKALVGTVYPQQSVFTISLSSDTEFCQWLFKPDTASVIYDTLSFYYKRNLQFLNNACGFAYFYTLDSVQTTRFSYLTAALPYSIDSAHITNASVTNNVNTTHQLQIYIRPHQ